MNFLMILMAKYLFLLVLLLGGWVGVKMGKGRRKELLELSLISLPLTYLIAKLLGHLYYDPRPFVVEHIQPLVAHAADNGFPSDHTLLAMAVSFIVLRFHKKAGLFLFFLSCLVAVARVYVRVHHPLDVIGSTLIAFIGVWISANYLIQLPPVKKLWSNIESLVLSKLSL